MPKLIEIEGATTESDFKLSEDILKKCLCSRCQISDGVHTFKLVPRNTEDARLLALVESDSDFEKFIKCPVILYHDGISLNITLKPCEDPIYLEHLIVLRDKELGSVQPCLLLKQTTSLDREPKHPKPVPRTRRSLSSSVDIGSKCNPQVPPRRNISIHTVTDSTVSKSPTPAVRRRPQESTSSEIEKDVSSEESSTEFDYYDCAENLPEMDKHRVFVENINPKTSKECLFNFLESKANATPVEMVKGDVPGVAMVTFKEEPDMEGLKEGCKKRPVEGHQLHISPVEKPCSVIVSDLPLHASVDSIKLTLENPRRGLGANVKSVQLVGSPGKALVVFADSSDAEKACDPSLHIKVEDRWISMNLHYPCLHLSNTVEPSQKLSSLPDAEQHTNGGYICRTELENPVHLHENLPEMDKHRVFVENINPKTSKECLFNFLESKANATPVEIVKGDVTGVAMVTFEEEPDVEGLKEGCKKRPVEGHQLRISPVEKPCSVIVSDLPLHASVDSIKLTLENPRRGLGANVKSVQLVGSPGKALVVFADSSDAEKACDPSLRIKVEDRLISMNLHHPCLHSSNTVEPNQLLSSLSSARENKQNATKRFKINVELFLSNFLSKSKIYREKLQVELMKKNCTLIFEDKTILVECQASCVNDALIKSAENEIFCFIGKNKLIIQKIPVEQSLHKSVYNKLNKKLVELKEMVNVYKKDTDLIVVGQTDSVQIIFSEIQEIKEHLTRKVSETMGVKNHYMQFLVVSKFENCLRKDFPNLNVTLDTRQNSVQFMGSERDIIDAKVSVQTYMSSILEKDVAFDNDMMWNFLEQLKTQEYLVRALAESGVVCCVAFQEATHVVRVYACSEKDLDKGQDLIKESIEEKIFLVVKQSKDCLYSSEWLDLKQSLLNRYAGKIVLEASEDNKVTVITTKDIAHDVQIRINKYLKTRAIQQQKFHLAKPVYRYFHEHKQHDILSIEKSLQSEKVKIDFAEKGLCISGTVTGVQQTMDELNKMKSKVVIKEVKLKQPGIKELLTKESGKEVILIVEKTQKCVIIPETEASQYAEEPEAAVDVNKKWSLSGDRTVGVHLGDITKLQVDAIVNAANVNLDHGGGIAHDIVKKGGSSIQDECSAFIKENGPLSDADVFSSSPGCLPCSIIIHAVGPQWQDGDQFEDTILAKTVNNILAEADKYQFTSVAIPALSTGIFGYPLHAAVTVIVEALWNYWNSKRSHGTVTDVCFCDVNETTIRKFVDVLEEKFGEAGASSPRSSKPLENSHTDDKGRDTESDSDTSSASSKGSASSESIQVIKGNLADQKVDVLVSPVSPNLDFSASMVSKSLLLKGGDNLQKKCNQKYSNSLDSGKIGVIDGGHLACKKVFFGCLQKMDINNHGKKVLSNFVTSCLKKAVKKSFTSVAFPALGTGKLRFPANISASLMYDAVKSHFQDNPSSTVQKVLFIIHPKDSDVLKAFQSMPEEGEHSQMKHYQDKTPSRSYHQKSSPSQYHKHSSEQDTFQCGGIKVQVLKGDITKESTDCIVNSTNSNLDLTKGAVSKALLAQAGPDLEEECETNRESMRTNGVALTGSGNLNCQYILHIKAQDSNYHGWFKILTKGLSLVEENGITSLSIPALGTGGRKCSVENVASKIAEAIKTFGHSHKSSNLKIIRLIIFNGHMVPAFKSAFTGRREHYSHRERDHSYKERAHQGVEDFKPKYSLSESFVITIYAEGEKVVQTAKETFIDQCKKKFERKTLNEELCGKLSDLTEEQKRLIQNAANEFGVELSVEDDLLEIFGLKENVSEAYDKIIKTVLDIKKSEHMRKEAKILSNLVHWYYIDRQGECQSFSLGNNAQLEKAYTAHEKTTEIKDPKGRSYKVDLKKMEEYPIDKKHIKIQIVRNDNKGSGQMQMVKGEKEAMANNKTVYFTLQAERTHKDTPEEHHYRTAESQFLRLLGTGAAQYRVLKVEYVVNPELIRKFRAAQLNLKKSRGEDSSHPILAFHGTNVTNIKKICEGGFLAPGEKGFKAKTDTGYYGAGVYFSEYPGYSMGYISGTTTMMLCQVLQGKPYTCPNLMHGAKLQSGYDSHVSPCGKELIIFNTSCILPSYLVHYGPNSSDFKYN